MHEARFAELSGAANMVRYSNLGNMSLMRAICSANG